jgi:hypothetical protein
MIKVINNQFKKQFVCQLKMISSKAHKTFKTDIYHPIRSHTNNKKRLLS